jgi:tyrosyl-tRNA synthetase
LQRHYNQPSQIVLMTPIIEGLDGVQKMSKSLNNAIGIHEPAPEMYGKVMSISDELMWRYWLLLTDVRQGEIEKMQADVASRILHPMEVKKRLARTIVAGFHSEAAAGKADEDWARQFQQRNVEGVAVEVAIDLKQVAVAASLEVALKDQNQPIDINVAKLLVALGLKNSRTEAERQVTAGVNIDGVTSSEKVIRLEKRPVRLAIRVGKQARIAVI